MLKRTKNDAVTDMLTKFDDSKRAVANLMARENITVQVIDGASSATFNPETRVLTVPNWTGLTVEQCDLLMSHEVGHALFTDRTVDVKSLSAGLFTYLNCIEDARIERRMKGAFPGLAPTFFKGYREFHANGPIFKGTSTSLFNPKTGEPIPVSGMKLIDRINLFYKIGAFVKVPFAADEQKWLARIDKATSTADCLAIARDMHREASESKSDPQSGNDKSSASKAKQTPKTEKQNSNPDSGNEQEAGQGSSDEGDDQDSDSQGAGQSSDDQSDENFHRTDENADQDGDGGNDDDGDSQGDSQGESKDADNLTSKGDSEGTDSAKAGKQGHDDSADTVTDVEEALNAIASKGTTNTILNLIYGELDAKVMDGRVITAKEWCELAHAEMLKVVPGIAPVLDRIESDWNAKYLATARHMALEFERRKTAKNMQNARVGKSGKLDLAKLSQYRWTEDLFKRTMTVPNGKSHGVVMVIDGSSSMSGVFANVIDQVLLFANFAFQVNIPFEAYMFSDVCRYMPDGTPVGQFKFVSQGVNVLTLAEAGRLIGLVNTGTDRAGFKRQVRALLAVRSMYANNLNTSFNQDLYVASHAIPYSSLGGTPLFTGVMIGERMLARMKRERKLDKTTFIVVTDGKDTNHVWFKASGVGQSCDSILRRGFEALYSGFVVRDTVTKRNLPFVTSARWSGHTTVSIPTNGILTMLFDIIKLRHDARTMYIFLHETNCYGRRRNYDTTAVRDMTRATKEAEVAEIDYESVKNALKNDGQFVLPAGFGVAELNIILASDAVAMTEDEFRKLDTDGMSQKKIAAEFTKSMVKATSNRKFVNSVVPYLA